MLSKDCDSKKKQGLFYKKSTIADPSRNRERNRSAIDRLPWRVYTDGMKQDATFWDVRLRAAQLRRGEMTAAQEASYLAELPDVEEKAVMVPSHWYGSTGGEAEDAERG